jgi:quinol monooxygenase YgiN
LHAARQTLPWILILYAAATLLHFAHNAQYLAQYPNLPASWSRVDVYAAWCCLTALGVAGYVLYVRDHRGSGLTFLALYAGLGFGGLLHYTRASMAHHSAIMNVTIWAEATAAALLLVNVAALRPGRFRVALSEVPQGTPVNRMNVSPPVTLINVFTVDPTKQQELVALLARATEASVRRARGFISARLHRSLDGTKVTMYAQWESRDAYQAMREDPGPRPYLERALAIATFEPGMYEVVQTFLPEAPRAE